MSDKILIVVYGTMICYGKRTDNLDPPIPGTEPRHGLIQCHRWQHYLNGLTYAPLYNTVGLALLYLKFLEHLIRLPYSIRCIRFFKLV